MKLSTKLISSFLFITFLLLAIGIVSQYLNNRVKDRVVEESEKAVYELKLSGEMGVLLYRSLINTQYFLEDRYRRSLGMEDSDLDLNFEQAVNRAEVALREFRQNLLAVDSVLSLSDAQGPSSGGSREKNEEILGKLKTKSDIYASLVEQLIPLTKLNYNDGKEFFTITIEPYFRTNVMPLLDRFREETQNNLDQEIAKLNSELNATSKILAMATVVALILSIVLACVLYRSITTPLQVLSIAAQHIGGGKLDERIDINSNDEIGRLGIEFNKMAENLSRTTVSENFMNDIIESMADGLIVTDRNHCIQRVNTATLRMLGYSEQELIGKSLSDIFVDKLKFGTEQFAAELPKKNYETACLRKNGNTFPVGISLALIHDRDGSAKGLVCVASDITQRKSAEQQISKSLREKEILLTEIHHRVKNNLAVISGLLQMQIWKTNDEAAETALKDSQLRVKSIALVHEKLYQSESLSFIEFDKCIQDQLNVISKTYLDTSGTIGIQTELDKVVLNINQAIPCSILLNEFVINAFKYAFNGKNDGVVSVKLWQEFDSDIVRLRVRDNGHGIPEDFSFEKPGTSDLSLIDTLVRQLEGEINMFNDGGAVFEISFTREEVA